jgi:hypothetical protein
MGTTQTAEYITPLKTNTLTNQKPGKISARQLAATGQGVTLPPFKEWAFDYCSALRAYAWWQMHMCF